MPGQVTRSPAHRVVNAVLALLLLSAGSAWVAAAENPPHSAARTSIDDEDAATLENELLRCAQVVRQSRETGLACYENLSKSIADKRNRTQPSSPVPSTVSNPPGSETAPEKPGTARSASLTLNPDKSGCEKQPVLFEADSANSIGYTKSNNDAGFMDVNLSVRAPLWYQYLADKTLNCDTKNFVYFGFDMRAAFYLGTRDSSPFITRWLNPSLHYRRFFDDKYSSFGQRNDHKAQYWDVAYGHLSNGQTIDSGPAFSEAAARLGNDDFARSYVSRGWDYASFKTHLSKESPHPLLQYCTVSLELRKFFGGLMQRHVEEFDAFEGTRSIMKLSQVRGIQLSSRLEFADNSVSRNLTLTYDTGLTNAFKWNTWSARLDLAFVKPLFAVPVAFWYSNGYMSDLAQYYRRASSAGVAFVFEANDR